MFKLELSMFFLEMEKEIHESETDKKLLEPLYYLTQIPGKKIRSKIIQVFHI